MASLPTSLSRKLRLLIQSDYVGGNKVQDCYKLYYCVWSQLNVYTHRKCIKKMNNDLLLPVFLLYKKKGKGSSFGGEMLQKPKNEEIKEMASSGVSVIF